MLLRASELVGSCEHGDELWVPYKSLNVLTTWVGISISRTTPWSDWIYVCQGHD